MHFIDIETEKDTKLGFNYFAIPGLGSLELTNLIYVISKCTKVKVATIRSKDQTRHAATARHLFSIVARNEYCFTYQYIADYLNRASHSTIKKSVQQAQNYLDTDKRFRKMYDRVLEELADLKDIENVVEVEGIE